MAERAIDSGKGSIGAPKSAQPIPYRASVAGRLLGYREVGVVIALAVVIITFFGMKREFLAPGTIGDILTIAAELGVAGVGVTFLMIAGEFDLSVGSNFALTGMLLAFAIDKYMWNPWLGLAAALALGAAIGLLNGIITLTARIPSFITTLGTMMLWRGIALFLTGGWPASILHEPRVLRIFGGAKMAGTLYVSAAWWLVVSLVFWLILGKTPYGNWVFATGGKQEAARALGVPTRRVKLLNFMLAGLLASFAGVLQLGRIGSMSPIWGDQLNMEAIAAAVIGGTSLAGGVGTILGTCLGAVTMAAIRTGLIMVGAPSYWYMAFIGIILIVAVVINVRLAEVLTWRK